MHDLLRASAISLLLAAVGTTGCCFGSSDDSPVRVTATATPVDPEHVRVDVETEPGAWVSVLGVTRPAGGPADATGRASFTVEHGAAIGVPIRLQVDARVGDRLGRAEPMMTAAAAFALAPDFLSGLTCTGPATCRVRVEATGVIAEPLPEGAVLTVEGVAVTARAGQATVPVDFAARVDRVGLARACTVGQVPLDTLATSIRLPDGNTASAALAITPSTMCALARGVFAGIARGPVLPAVPAGSAVAYVDGDVLRLAGAPQRLADVRVVVVQQVSEREAPCGSYVASDGVTQPIVRVLHDVDATAHDRRTGAALGRRRFVAPDIACPRNMLTGQDLTSHANPTDVLAWAGTL